MKLNLIVAAVDVKDDLARAVIVAAQDLAWRDHAKVHVVSAWPLIPPASVALAGSLGPMGGDISPELMQSDREARAADESALKSLAAAAAPGAVVKMLDGDPAGAVVAYAKDLRADIIVAGTHQRGFWGAVFEGGASRDLVKAAPCGVFLVTKPYAERLLAVGAGS
jgi:nucleotide-binding universal stress UspA family protein